MQMETIMKGNGLMIKLREEASTSILMVLCMLVIGLKTGKMGMELKLGLITLNMKVTIHLDKSTGSVLSNGLMVHHILENS